MAIYSGHVSTGAGDYEIDVIPAPDITGSTGVTMSAARNRDFVDGSLTKSQQAYADIDTSGIDSSWVLSEAVLHWYTHSYAITPKGDSHYSWIAIHNGTAFEAIEGQAASRSIGWGQYTLNATQRGYINDTGNTRFRFNMGDSTTYGSIRTWALRTFEYDEPNNAYSVYLEITYEIPATGRRHRFIAIG